MSVSIKTNPTLLRALVVRLSLHCGTLTVSRAVFRHPRQGNCRARNKDPEGHVELPCHLPIVARVLPSVTLVSSDDFWQPWGRLDRLSAVPHNDHSAERSASLYRREVGSLRRTRRIVHIAQHSRPLRLGFPEVGHVAHGQGAHLSPSTHALHRRRLSKPPPQSQPPPSTVAVLQKRPLFETIHCPVPSLRSHGRCRRWLGQYRVARKWICRP